MSRPENHQKEPAMMIPKPIPKNYVVVSPPKSPSPSSDPFADRSSEGYVSDSLSPSRISTSLESQGSHYYGSDVEISTADFYWSGDTGATVGSVVDCGRSDVPHGERVAAGPNNAKKGEDVVDLSDGRLLPATVTVVCDEVEPWMAEEELEKASKKRGRTEGEPGTFVPKKLDLVNSIPLLSLLIEYSDLTCELVVLELGR